MAGSRISKAGISPIIVKTPSGRPVLVGYIIAGTPTSQPTPKTWRDLQFSLKNDRRFLA